MSTFYGHEKDWDNKKRNDFYTIKKSPKTRKKVFYTLYFRIHNKKNGIYYGNDECNFRNSNLYPTIHN